jgi:hypothetical protein
MDSSGTRWGLVVGSCEHSNEPSGSTEDGKFEPSGSTEDGKLLDKMRQLVSQASNTWN